MDLTGVSLVRQLRKLLISLCVLSFGSLLLSSCTTTFIPGLDRLIWPDSSASVGPLIADEEEYPLTVEENVRSEGAAVVDKVETEIVEPIGRQNAEPKAKATPPPVEEKELPKARNSATADPVPSKTPSVSRLNPPSSEAKEQLPEIFVEYGGVKGKVYLLGEQEKELSVEGTMVTLTPMGMNDEAEDHQPQVHIIDMEDKIYRPRYSTIRTGDQVVFVNKDNIRHNVFSSSGKNAFDLGTYGAGLKRAVTLKESGIVKIYCNIHAEMATFVAVGDQGFSAQVDGSGSYQINNVLPGDYELTIWNIRGETKRTLQVVANKTMEFVDRIDATGSTVEPHKNKFGSDYSKNSVIFEDEFY